MKRWMGTIYPIVTWNVLSADLGHRDFGTGLTELTSFSEIRDQGEGPAAEEGPLRF